MLGNLNANLQESTTVQYIPRDDNHGWPWLEDLLHVQHGAALYTYAIVARARRCYQNRYHITLRTTDGLRRQCLEGSFKQVGETPSGLQQF